jgi:hypothetical protein
MFSYFKLGFFSWFVGGGGVRMAEAKVREGLKLKPSYCLYCQELPILLWVIFQFSDLHTQIFYLITKKQSIVQNFTLLFLHISNLLIKLSLRGEGEGVSRLLIFANKGESGGRRWPKSR